MASSSGANIKRGKTEIKEVEQTNRRYVTFSKRKLGLFNKLTELSLLCQVETALIITSQNGKLYSCGYPDPGAVVRRYLTGGDPVRRNRAGRKEQQEFVEKQRLEYEAIQNQLKEQQKRLQEIKGSTTENNSNKLFSCWWNLPTEDMGLEDVELFKTSLERLKFNLVGALQEKQMNNSSTSTMIMQRPPPSTVIPPPLPYTMVPPQQQFSNMPLLDFSTSAADQCFGANQVQDYYQMSDGFGLI